MRKLLACTVVLLLLVSLVACGGGDTPGGSTPAPEESTTPSATTTVLTDPTASTSTTATSTDTTDTTGTSVPSTTVPSGVTVTTTTTKKPVTTTATTKKPVNDNITWEKPMTNYKSNAYTDCIDYRTPLTNTYNKLTKDKELTVVYFGGSLTNGYGCSDRNKYSWRALSGQWLKDNFPDANIKTVDTAIGESGTHLGVYRVQRDVIGSKPDLLFVEYAINDNYDRASRSVAALRFETIVREVRKALPNCDIVTVLTTDKTYASKSMNLQLFEQAAGHASIAEAYGLPVVNIGSGMVRNIAKVEGNNTWWNDTTLWEKYFKRKADGKADGVHPNDAGHNQYYLVVKEYLENSLKNTDYTGLKTTARKVPSVQSEYLFDGNRTAVAGADLQKYLVADKSADAILSTTGVFTTSTSQTPHKGFYMVKKGGYATFTFEGTDFSIWTDCYSPTKLTYSVDGGAEKTITFDNHAPTIVVSGLKSGKHTITLKPESNMKLGYIFTRDTSKQTLQGAN